MPKISDINTVNEIARHYVSNGHNKVQALLSAGYSNKYANERGLRLFNDARLCKAIASLEAESAQIAGYTIDQCQREYEEARQRSILLKQPSAEISAITGKARLYGMDKDNSAALKDTTDLSKYTDAELEQIRRQAIAITKTG